MVLDACVGQSLADAGSRVGIDEIAVEFEGVEMARGRGAFVQGASADRSQLAMAKIQYLESGEKRRLTEGSDKFVREETKGHAQAAEIGKKAILQQRSQRVGARVLDAKSQVQTGQFWEFGFQKWFRQAIESIRYD